MANYGELKGFVWAAASALITAGRPPPSPTYTQATAYQPAPEPDSQHQHILFISFVIMSSNTLLTSSADGYKKNMERAQKASNDLSKEMKNNVELRGKIHEQGKNCQNCSVYRVHGLGLTPLPEQTHNDNHLKTLPHTMPPSITPEKQSNHYAWASDLAIATTTDAANVTDNNIKLREILRNMTDRHNNGH